MGTMNAFLRWLDTPETHALYDKMHNDINSFIERANASFDEHNYPIKLTNWFSVWSIIYTTPGRYHWMFQYYLKDAGVNLSWVGTGRLLFSLEWKKEDYDRLLDRLLVACAEMKKGGWWEPPVASIKGKLMTEIGGAVIKNAISSFTTQS